MIRVRIAIALVILVCAVLRPGVASASDVDQARALFNAGAQAYDSGDYPSAIEAFEAAFARSPRAGIAFSLAQAHRRLYHTGGDPKHLRSALARYREYLERDPKGARRSEAVQALVELEPLLSRHEAPGGGDAPSAREAEPKKTRLMVTSQAKGATIALDGAAPVPTPLVASVQPGKHRITVSADGFAPVERIVFAVQGDLAAYDFPLRELPARLIVRGENGAEVLVDGQYVGQVPLGPMEVKAGARTVTIRTSGHVTARRDVRLARGETKTIDVTLEWTTQRRVALGVLGLAGAGVVAGGVLAALAVNSEADAESVLDESRDANITPAELRSYTDAVDARERFGRAAAITWGASAAVALTGVGLLLFDPPGPPPEERYRRDARSRSGVALVVAPGLGRREVGATLLGAF